MDDSPGVISNHRRYSELLEALLRRGLQRCTPFIPEAETDSAIQVERGVIFAQAVMEQAILESSLGPFFRTPAASIAPMDVVDRAGHHRTIYRGLLTYAALQAFQFVCATLPRSAFERWEKGLRPWCDLLAVELTSIDLPLTRAVAGRGSRVTEVAWIALALFMAGKAFVREDWINLAGETFGQLARGQQRTGALLASTASDNPETVWYDELVLLHALSSFAVQTEDRSIAAVVQRAAVYHLEETQPDHATSQPWSIVAFIWNAQAQPLADQILHSADIQHPEGLDGVSLILLADALMCLRRLIRR